MKFLKVLAALLLLSPLSQSAWADLCVDPVTGLYITCAPPSTSSGNSTGSFTTLSASGVITSTLATGTAPFTIASTTNVANLNASTLSGATFANPGAIGGGVQAAGSFTTLSASSTVSGSGFSTYLASPPAIGGSAAAAGSFTTLAASSTVSGTGFSTYLASPPAIGGSAPAAGAFTSLSSTGIPTVNGKSSTVTLFRWGVPVILPSSGDFGANGALVLTTAITSLNTICSAAVGCYMYFPSAAICATCNAGGVSAAGMYYATCSSTTACTVYTDRLTTGVPVKVASPVAFVAADPAAYTQTTGAFLAMISLSIPANSIGANGSFTITTQAHRISNANTVSQQVTYAGTAFGVDSAVSIQWQGYHHSLYAMGATNAQYGIASTAASDEANINAVPTFMAFDSTSAQTSLINLDLVTAATDWGIILGGAVVASYAP